MANEIKPDSGHVPLTGDQVRHLAGPITDHTVVEVLEMQPTLEELQVAALHARGQIGHTNALVEELSGTAALLYDILMQDESYQAQDERS